MLRRLLSVTVLWGFPAACLALVATTVWLCLPWFVDDETPHWAVLFIMVPLSVAVVFAFVAVVRRRQTDDDDVSLSRSDEPRLWALIDEVAAEVGTPSPDRLVVEEDNNAYVVHRGDARTLMLGLPLLEVLDVAQVRAVLAHELGHFAGGDTKGLARTAAVEEAMDMAMHGAGPIGAPLVWAYRWLYRAVDGLHSRDKERLADETSVRIAGSDAVLRALRDIGRIAVVEEDLDLRVSMFVRAGVRAPVGEALRRLLGANQDEVDRRLSEFLADEPTGAHDSHPPLGARIDAVTALPHVARASDDTPVRTLLSAAPGALDARLLMRDLPLTDWASVARACGPEEVRTETLALRDFGLEHEVAHTLGGLLDRLDRGGLEEDDLEWATWLLASAVREALLPLGLARAVDIDWMLGGDLLWEERVPELAEARGAALDGRTGQLRAALESVGVDVTAPPAEPRIDWFRAVRSHLRRGRARVDCYLFRSGILLLPSEATMLPQERMERVGKVSFDAARSLEGAEWLPVADMRAMSLLGGKISMRGGRTIRLRDTDQTLDLPDEDDVLQAIADLRGLID